MQIRPFSPVEADTISEVSSDHSSTIHDRPPPGPPPIPSKLQSHLTSLVLIFISLVLAPITLIPTIAFSLLTSVLTSAYRPAKANQPGTVLVTGSRTTKALVLTRAFAKAGHRVVIADEKAWHRWSASVRSRSVHAAYGLPDAAKQPGRYVEEVARLLVKEDVKLWVPCSSAAATVADARAAIIARSKGWKGRATIQSNDLAKTLHEKDLFTFLCKELGVSGVPEGRPVLDPETATAFLHREAEEAEEKGTKKRYILKAIGYGDDIGRSDVTPLPLRSRQDTYRYLKPRFDSARRRAPPDQRDSPPFVLQRFLPGREYCTHAYFVPSSSSSDSGSPAPPELRLFVCCRSSDMLMRYADVRSILESQGRDRRAGEKAEAWSREFMAKLAEKYRREGKSLDGLEGHYSFDFMTDDDGELYVIECNPRVHTAITLFGSLGEGALASAYLRPPNDPSSSSEVLRPSQYEPAHIWTCHAVPLSLANLVPFSFRTLLPLLNPLLPPSTHAPLATTSPPPDGTYGPYGLSGPVNVLKRATLMGIEKDAVWDPRDPWPWWYLAHVQWPLWLLGLVLGNVGWSRINVSTSRIFTT